MGVVGCVGKVVLVVVNILILLLSLVLLACGVIIIAGKDLYNSLLDSFKQELETSLTSAGLTVSTEDLSLSELMMPLAYGIIALGVVMGAVALLGCCGGCYSIKIVLIIYGIITSVLFIVQAVIVVLIYVDRSAFDATAKEYVKKTLDDYSGIEGTDAKTLSWNALMSYSSCCGVDGYGDFAGLANWPPATIGGQAVSNLETPIMCCKAMPDFSGGAADYSCAQAGTADATNNFYTTGCYDELFDMIADNALVRLTLGAFLAFQFIMIFFTIWIICTMDNKIDII